MATEFIEISEDEYQGGVSDFIEITEEEFNAPQKPKESSIGDMLQGVAMDLEDTIGVIGRLPEALVSGIPAQYQKLVAGTGMPEKSEAIESDLEFQKRNNQELEDRAASGKLGPLGKAFRQAAPSIAGTVMSMGAAIPGGIIGGALSGPAAPVGGFVGAGAASGAVSYRMQGADYLYRAFKQLEENKGSPLTDEEKAGAYEVLLPLAQESALWEAGPEAIGNAVSLGVGKFVFGFGKAKATQLATQSVAEVEKTLARKITEKSAAIAGGATTEVGTETITALGQYAPEMAAQQYVKTGTIEGAPTEYPGGIMQAVKDVAPATLATQALVMGAGGAIKLATVPFANKPKTPEQIAEDNINIDANAESVNLSIDPDDEVSKGLSETIKSTQSNLISKKEIYSSLEPTDNAAQILKLEIKEDENKLILLQSELNKRTGVAIPEVEKQQAELIKEIIEPEAAITPAAPAPVSETPAAEVTPVAAEPVAEAAPQVVEGLQAVSENTATPEQLTELSQSGLVDIVKGQPVINEEGQAVLTKAEAPLPKLTPEERRAEIEVPAITPAPVAETPAVTEAPAAEVAPAAKIESVGENKIYSPVEISEQDTGAYHFGDGGIASDTTMRRMGAGRGTGHYGTGTYFLGSKEADVQRADRPMLNINLAGLNMVKPGRSAIRFHDMLRFFNKSVLQGDEIRFYQPSDIGSRVFDLLDIALIGQVSGDRKTRLKDAMLKVEGIFKSGTDDKLRTPSTYLMQELGFDGIDVRGTEADNTTYGSVVFAKPILETTPTTSAAKAAVSIAPEPTGSSELIAGEGAKPLITKSKEEGYLSEAKVQDVSFDEKKNDTEEDPYGRSANTIFYIKDKNGEQIGVVWADKYGKDVEIRNAEIVKNKRNRGFYTSFLSELSANYNVISDEPVNNAVENSYELLGATKDPRSGRFILKKKKISQRFPTPAVSETITPAAEPAGITIGNRIKLGKSPQTYTVEQVIPQSETERGLGEQFYSVKNERTGEVQVVEKADMKQVGGKKARKMAGEVISKQEAVTPIPEADRYTFEEAVKAVDAHFGKKGIPEGVVIVNNTTDKDLEMRAGYFVNRGQIVINLAYIAKGENLGDIIDHELGHYIFGDPKFQDDFKQFWDAMTPEEQAQADKIINQFYNQETGAIQVEEKQVRAFMQLIQESKAMPKWKQLLDSIKRWINEKLGTNFQVTDRGAMTVLAAAHKRFKSGEQIIREIDSGVLKAAAERQQVGGIKMGETKKTPKGIIAETQAKLRERFNPSKVTEENTTEAFRSVGKLLGKEGNAFAEELNDVTRMIDASGAASEISMGAALFVNDLFEYSVRLASEGQKMLLGIMLTNINRLPTAGVGRSDAGRTMRAAKEMSSIFEGMAQAERDSFTAYAAEFVYGPNPTKEQIDSIKIGYEAAEGVKEPTTDQVIEGVDAAGVRSGVDLVAKINAEIDKAVAPENKDPFVAAIAVMMKLGGDFGFKFSTLPPVNKIKSAVSETIKGGLANYRKKMVSGAATGLETGFWKTLSSQENKPGPLGELDSAQNRELGNIVKSTLVSLGLKGTPPDTKMSIYEQVASILGEKPLSTDKTELADKNIRSEINRKKQEELESTDDPDIQNAIESKWSQIEFAWDEAMARQLNMPVSDALLRRLIFNELKEAKTSIGKLSDLMNEEPVIGTKRQNDIINSVIQKVAGITFEGQNPSDYSLLKEYLGNQLEGMIIANQTKARAGKTKAQIAKEAKGSVELQAEKAENEAQKQIDRLAKIQSDTPSFPPEAEMNPVREAVKNALKLNLNQMFGAKESADIISNFKKSFTSQLVSLGVKEAPASILADVVGRQIEINSLNNQLKSIDRAVEKGPINEIINAIKNTPLEEQQNPKWRYEVMLNYLRKAGLTPAQAERIAKLMDLSIQKRFIEAKEKAFSDAISKTAPWKEGNVRSKRAFKQVIETIRAGALDPARNMISDIAAMNGWTGFSADQYKKLLEFDKILANEESAQVDKAEAYKGVQDIISKSKLPIRAREVIAQYYDAQALSGIPTFSVNTFSPIAFAARNALIESTVRVLSGDIKGVSREATVFVDSIRSWANTVAYSFKNNVTVYSNVDYIVNDDKLLQLFRKGVEQFNKGKTERQKADGIKNMLIGMMDYVRRILNALDYGAIQSVQNQNIGKYAMAVMRRQGMNNKEANEMFGVLMKAKGDFYIQLIAAGEDKNKAGVLADEFMISAWIDALDKRGVQKSRIQEALNAALNDAMSTVGRNRQSLDSFRGEETNIKDSGVVSFLPVSLLEDIAAAANKSESASKRLFARALYGFAITPARVLRETAWFSPYGIVRFGYDAIAKKMGKTSPYAQSLGNDLQRRQRLIEATAATVATIGLYSLITGSTDDPDDKKPFKLTFTGNGPRRKDDAQFYDSWYKVGNKPNSMILSFGKTNITLNMMRGFEAFTWPAIILGAVDDWEIRKKQKRMAKTEAGFVDAAIVAGFVFDAGLKRGPYAFTTKSLFGAYGDTGPETIAKGLTFPAKTLIPVLGSSFAMNISNSINDPIDRRTLEGALWSNIPLIGPVVAPKSYNAFGEPALSTDLASKAFKLGVPIVFDIPSDRESVKIHELILKQGGGPSLPTRTQLAQRLDMEPTNKEYEVFVKEYGFLFDAILRENYEEFSEMAPDVYSAVIEKIGLNIRDAAEEKVRESQNQNVR